MIKAGLVGATGYTGAELLRLLLAHPQVQLAVITSRAESGRQVSEIFPWLGGHLDLAFQAPEPKNFQACDVVFFATPHATAMHQAPALLQAGIKVIDLSADFRLQDAALWAEWYGERHVCPELLSEAVYGLPEANRERIKTARLLANPGCYPTAVQLGFLPLLEGGLVEPRSLIADAKSGVSGAGRKEAMATQFCESADSFKAYSAAGHRHLPEIEQGLAAANGGPVDLVFVPHLAPMIRGIHATLYARMREVEVDLQAVFAQRYQAEPFVDVMPMGSHPDTRGVRGANTCRLAWHRPQGGETVVILAVVDNLVKGASGQALQNMNIMFGLPETTGLSLPALAP